MPIPAADLDRRRWSAQTIHAGSAAGGRRSAYDGRSPGQYAISDAARGIGRGSSLDHGQGITLEILLELRMAAGATVAGAAMLADLAHGAHVHDCSTMNALV